MTWIESHQALRDHPKTRKLARLLGIGRPQAIGHLQCLWWWATDYAEDGDLSRYDALDIAIAADWEDAPEKFAQALVDAGFVDEWKGDQDGWFIHDWDEYAGKLIERRRANAQRMREARAQDKPSRAAHVQRTQRARAERPNRTVPNQPTVPETSSPPETEQLTIPAQPQQNGATAPPPEAAQPIAAKVQPFDLLAAMCDAVGQEPIVLSEREKSKQLAVAKRLIADGVSPPDVEAITTWLAAQPGRTTGIDMFTVEQNLTRWRLKGKPTANGIDVSHLPWNHPKRAAITGKGIIG